MTFWLSLMIGANALADCVPPAGGALVGRYEVGSYHAQLCYRVVRRPILVTWA